MTGTARPLGGHSRVRGAALSNVQIQAALDQFAALVRDTFDTLGVNIHDPVQARAAHATVLLIEGFDEDNLPVLFAALRTALAS